MKTERVDWIDCAKGIGMILVIISHTFTGANSTEQFLRGILFSFHMPLFFILSCMTFRFSGDDAEFVRKTRCAFRHLCVPALFIYLVNIIIEICISYQFIDWKWFWIGKLKILVYSSGTDVHTGGTVIPAFGMMWFTVVLFTGRSLFDYLHLKLKPAWFAAAVFLLTLAGVLIGERKPLLLSFDIAMSVMLFFYFGDRLKRTVLRKSTAACITAFALWLSTFLLIYYGSHDYLELAARRYPVFPICYFTAVSGTMFIIYLCRLAEDLSWIRPVIYIGRYSLYLYGVHAMDYLYKFAWNRTNNGLINGMIRVCLDYIAAMVLIKAVQFCHCRKI